MRWVIDRFLPRAGNNWERIKEPMGPGKGEYIHGKDEAIRVANEILETPPYHPLRVRSVRLLNKIKRGEKI